MNDARMPQRPREHQLERESRERFRSLLPASWVPRPVDPDYGIDEEVEIFDEGGIATGRLFLAQIKGTDEPVLSSALAVRLRIQTVNYLREQDLPVLIVRYHTIQVVNNHRPRSPNLNGNPSLTVLTSKRARTLPSLTDFSDARA